MPNCQMRRLVSVPFWRALVSNRKAVSPLCCSIRSNFPFCFGGRSGQALFPFCSTRELTADQYRYLLEDSRAKAVFVSTGAASCH